MYSNTYAFTRIMALLSTNAFISFISSSRNEPAATEKPPVSTTPKKYNGHCTNLCTNTRSIILSFPFHNPFLIPENTLEWTEKGERRGTFYTKRKTFWCVAKHLILPWRIINICFHCVFCDVYAFSEKVELFENILWSATIKMCIKHKIRKNFMHNHLKK